MTRGPQPRRCVACGATVIDAYRKDGHFNCVTGTIAQGLDRPAECWFIQHQDLAQPFLEALRPIKNQGKITTAKFEKKAAFAKGVITLETENNLTRETLKPLVEIFGRVHTGRLIAAIDPKYPIKAKLISLFHGQRKHKALPKPPKTAKPPKPVPEIIELPPEFDKALEIWSEISHRRANRQIKIGNNYDAKTASRRVADARKFLEFLVKNGVRSWASVSQVHLDEFTVTFPRRLAQKAFSFWNAIRTHFPMHAKLVGPRKEKNTPITERIISEEKYRSILKAVSQERDTGLALCICFVLIYAQTIIHASKLTLCKIRQDGNKYQICFNEIWVPIDPITQRLLEKRLSEIKRENINIEDTSKLKIFSDSVHSLESKMLKLTGVNAKKLRSTAVRKILLNGYTDRKGIELSLGVSMQTVRMIEKSCAWDLQDYVQEEVRSLRKDLLNGKIS